MYIDKKYYKGWIIFKARTVLLKVKLLTDTITKFKMKTMPLIMSSFSACFIICWSINVAVLISDLVVYEVSFQIPFTSEPFSIKIIFTLKSVHLTKSHQGLCGKVS